MHCLSVISRITESIAFVKIAFSPSLTWAAESIEGTGKTLTVAGVWLSNT